MAEEEVKVVEAEEEKKENPEGDQYTLVTFILSCVALCVCPGWIVGGIAAIVLAAISMKRLRSDMEPTKQPFITFRRVAKPVAIVALILGIISVIAWTIAGIVSIVNAAIAAANA